MKEKFLTGSLIFLDCETTVNTFTVHNELLYIQIAVWDLKEFYAIENYRQLRTSLPEIHIINTSDTTDELSRFKQLLRELLQDEKKNVVFFNAPFDLAHLLKWLYPDVFFSGMNLFTYSQDYINCKIWDLYLLSKIIHSGYKKNTLADWSRRLASQQLNKSLQKSFKKNSTLTAEQEVYMKQDVEVMMYIFLQFRIENYSWFNSFEVDKTSAFEIYRLYLLKLIFEAIDAYFRGLNVNYPQLSELASKETATLQELNLKFYEITQIQPKLVKSGKSFEALLKKQIPNNIWEILPRTKTGLIKLSFKELEIFQKKYNSASQMPPLLIIFTEILKKRKEILQIQKFQKSIFANRLVFFNYDLYGAVTGRITTRNYPIQASPRALRKTIIPNKGNIFIVADVSQEEVRILTQIAKDEALLKIFKNNLDFHSYTGSLLIGMNYEKFCKLKELEPEQFKSVRFLAKTLNFGLLYGMGAKTLHRNLEKGGIFQSEKTTYQQWSKWQKAYKGILKYHKNMEMIYWRSKFHNLPIFASYNKNKQNFFSITSLGGRAKRDEKLDIGSISYEKFKFLKYYKTECANFPIQATGVDILSEVWQKFSQECYGYARVVMVVHDEIVIETSKDNYDKVVSIIRKIEKEVGDKYVPLVGLKFEISEPLNFWTK